jgi:hypothetical protein
MNPEQTPALNAHNKEEFPPMHTTEHILNRTMVTMFGCPRSMNAHIEKKKSKCDYDLSAAPTETEIAEIERRVNDVIARKLPVTTEFMPREEAAAIVDLRKLPANASDTLRIVRVGDYDVCACIGAHVSNTSEIEGRFAIISSDFAEGKWRVRFKLEAWRDEQKRVLWYSAVMTQEQWDYFAAFRNRFRAKCEAWASSRGEAETKDWLARLQKEAADADENPAYPLETPIVYNRSLDAITQADDIRIIVVGDNPGKDEQLAKNQRYLVGQAGKLGEGFFRNNPELGTDFRKNVIILNKTPIHTAKTKQLAHILKNSGNEFAVLFTETQIWMARETAALQKALGCGLWLVGYAELRPKGLFGAYADELKKNYASSAADGNPDVRVFQHFSMNRFSIDLKDHYDKSLTLASNLAQLGLARRREILGW